jgi:hypothetical protein
MDIVEEVQEISIEEAPVSKLKANEKAKLITYKVSDEGSVTIDIDALRSITVAQVKASEQNHISQQVALVVHQYPALWGELQTASDWKRLRPIKRLGLARAALNKAAETIEDTAGWTHQAHEMSMEEIEEFNKSFVTGNIEKTLYYAAMFGKGAPDGLHPNDTDSYENLSYYGTFLPIVRSMYKIAQQSLNDFLNTTLPSL